MSAPSVPGSPQPVRELKDQPPAWEVTVKPGEFKNNIQGTVSLDLRNLQYLNVFSAFENLANAGAALLAPFVEAGKLPVWIFHQTLDLARRTVYELPTIATAAALAVKMDLVAGTHQPTWKASLEPNMTGALKVGAFVGTAFLLKTALNPYFDNVIHSANDPRYSSHPGSDHKYTAYYTVAFRRTAIRYLIPLALTLGAAHYTNAKLKPLESSAYAAALFAAVHLAPSWINSTLNHFPVVNSLLDTFWGLDRTRG